jgi:molybdopterin adenylyltransferase
MLEEHRRNAKESVICAVMTVSDTRTKDTDKSGKLIVDLLQESGNEVCHYQIVPDEKVAIQEAIEVIISDTHAEVLILNGGTGISFRDVTVEAIQPLFTKEIPGFGELFRILSYQLDIGSASMLSRAVAGVVNHRVIFATPGSTKAVKLAMEKLILPELSHVVREVSKDLNGKR